MHTPPRYSKQIRKHFQSQIDNLLDQIKDLHGEKSLHNTDDLANLIGVHEKSFDKALQNNALYPCVEGVEKTLELAEKIKDGLYLFRHEAHKLKVLSGYSENRPKGVGNFVMPILDYFFNFQIDERDVDRAINTMNSQIDNLKKQDNLFNELRKTALQEIKLKPMPNDLLDEGEDIYFLSGKIIVPTSKNSTYSVFDINTFNGCKCGKEHVRLSQLNEEKVTSLENAIQRYVDPDMIQTVVIAENTENYPIFETVVPIVGEKYEKKLFGR